MTSTLPVATVSTTPDGFSLEQTHRWEAWQRASAVSARRSDRICRAVAAALFLALLVAAAVTAARP
ncbi:MAG TPA: hypothetical protein VL173_13720 [Vicinamibacterales bacterium]|jgi:hypothetical protein|nr:hypothetical protein [Vicinamibacterales bacterium]